MSGEAEREARLAMLMASAANQLTEENGEWCWLEIASAVMAATRTPSDADRTAVVEECALHAECAFDDRPRSRVGHPSHMHWEDGYREGTKAAATAIRRLSTPAGEDRP